MSNSAWTGNTVITTTSVESSDSTVLPILYDCSACGGNGYGLALAGLPTDNPEGVLFALSNLPAFTIGTDGEPQTISTAVLLAPSSSTATTSFSIVSSSFTSPTSSSVLASASAAPSSVSSSLPTGPSTSLSTSSLSLNTFRPSNPSAQPVSKISANSVVSLDPVPLSSSPVSSMPINTTSQLIQVSSSNTDQYKSINTTPNVNDSTLQYFSATITATVSAHSTKTFLAFTVTAPSDQPTAITTLATWSYLVSSEPPAEASSLSIQLSLYEQSIATRSSQGAYGGVDGTTLDPSAASYARLPACTAKQKALIEAHPNSTSTYYITYTASGSTTITGQGLGTAALTFTGPSTNTHAYMTVTERQPSPAEACCGVCAIYFNNVQLFYWPAPGAVTECLTNSSYYPGLPFHQRKNRRTLNGLDHVLGGVLFQEATKLDPPQYHTTIPPRIPPGHLEVRGTNDSFPRSTVIDGFTMYV